MSNLSRFSEIAALAGNPARAAMLNALLDGRAFTANELSRVAGVTPQTGSGHLAGLVRANLVRVQKQGRHRYHRLASAAVAHMLEGIMQVAAETAVPTALTVGPRDAVMRAGRTCYDHLAGRLGVALADALVARAYVELDWDAGVLTDAGAAFFAEAGIDLAGPDGRNGARAQRVFCRPCLDWSERRPHIAGAVGAALRTACFDRAWIRAVDGSRAVTVTPKGQQALREKLGIDPSRL